MESRSSIVSRCKSLALDWAALDLRALAVLRVVIASTLLMTLWQRGTELRFFFSDEGMAPRSWLFSEFFATSALSVYTISGHIGVIGSLYALHMGLALAVICGWHTRWSTPALWLFTVSLCHRNSILLDGGDELTRILLFWGIFLPWGRVWSWDAYRSGSFGTQATAFASPWTLALLIQACLVYGFAGWAKSGVEWLDGSAGQLFLAQASMVRPWSQVLLQYPDLLEASVLALLWLERAAPVLILFPFLGLWPRVVAVALLSAFQLGMLAIADFPLLSIAYLVFTLSLLPPRILSRSEPPKVAWEASRLGSSVALFLVLMVLFWNSFIFNYVVEYPNRYILPRPVKLLMTTLGVNQFWAFFAPFPPRVYGWMVAEAVLADGSTVDLVSGEEPMWEEPDDLYRRVPNHSWRMVTRASVTIASARENLLLGLIRRFERKHPGKKVLRADLYHVQIRTEVDGQKTGPQARWLGTWPPAHEHADESVDTEEWDGRTFNQVEMIDHGASEPF